MGLQKRLHLVLNPSILPTINRIVLPTRVTILLNIVKQDEMGRKKNLGPHAPEAHKMAQPNTYQVLVTHISFSVGLAMKGNFELIYKNGVSREAEQASPMYCTEVCTYNTWYIALILNLSYNAANGSSHTQNKLQRKAAQGTECRITFTLQGCFDDVPGMVHL